MKEFSPEVVEALEAAGWHRGRQVDVEGWRAGLAGEGLRMPDAAAEFLASFGGLKFDLKGRGITRGKEPFDLDPLVAAGEEGRFVDWGREIGRALFPIGELDGGHFFLAIDEEGEIYCLADRLGSFGRGVEGLEGLILGVMPEWRDAADC
ncbi:MULTISPECIES: SUKH-3 domain-containing protein [Amycolatopsis]|uniref:SUKH-3 domain-containing protein n=1 Tax=Amycolatopsis sp. cg13 TaxID=3238807 RepID=UPI003524BB3E